MDQTEFKEELHLVVQSADGLKEFEKDKLFKIIEVIKQEDNERKIEQLRGFCNFSLKIS